MAQFNEGHPAGEYTGDFGGRRLKGLSNMYEMSGKHTGASSVPPTGVGGAGKLEVGDACGEDGTWP